jgi:hypothetical protein
MAIMPGAIWRPLPGSSTTRMSAYDITCLHTMVGSLAGTDSYFRQGSGVNSHFGTGGDGTIYQWVDTAFRSGANLNGNDHVVSIENADMGPEFAAWNTNDGNAVPAFTAAQVEANAKIIAWVNKTHGVPFDPIPDSKRGRRGTGWHRLGVPANKGDTVSQTGGELWSNSAGKVCPGNRRTAQIPQIIDRARQIAGGSPTSTGGFLMALSDAQQNEIYAALIGGNTGGRNNFHWLDSRTRPYTAYRNSDNGNIYLGAPGQWIPVPSEALYRMYLDVGLCQPFESLQSLPTATFDAVGAAYLGS